MPLSLPPAMRMTFSRKEFSPAMVRLGLEAMESLYHRTPFRVRISSMRCSTPPNSRAKSRMMPSGTRPSTAAMAAR